MAHASAQHVARIIATTPCTIRGFWTPQPGDHNAITLMPPADSRLQSELLSAYYWTVDQTRHRTVVPGSIASSTLQVLLHFVEGGLVIAVAVDSSVLRLNS